jgi:uncharacterized membrane protein YdjX (TVP38/TMEM64 family)
VVRTLFGEQIKQMAEEKNRFLFKIPQERLLEFSLLFMAIPSLPYAAKNYLLPVTGISFHHYFLISWLAQGVMGIPIVLLGNATSNWNWGLVLVLVGILVMIYLFVHTLHQRFERLTRANEQRANKSLQRKENNNHAL